MIVNNIFVVPDEGTLDYFNRQFSGCPFRVIPEEFRVIVASSPHSIVPDPDRTYVAQAGNMKLFPNTANGGSSLILPLISFGLMKANAEYYEASSPAYPTIYSPHIVIVENMPPLRRYIKAWINSLSGTFRNEVGRLGFGNETLETVEVEHIPSYGYLLEQEAIVKELSRRSSA